MILVLVAGGSSAAPLPQAATVQATGPRPPLQGTENTGPQLVGILVSLCLVSSLVLNTDSQ
jgi:hypothetical protein